MTPEEIHARFGTDPNWRQNKSVGTAAAPAVAATPGAVVPVIAPVQPAARLSSPASIHERFGTDPDWRSKRPVRGQIDEYGMGITRAFSRGMERLMSLPDVMQGDYEELAEHNRAMEQYKMSDEDTAKLEAIRETEGFWNKAGELMMEPRLVMQVIAESLPMMVAPIAGAIGGGLAGGAAAGPLAPAGAIAGSMIGGGMGSYFTEYYASIGEFFGEEGVNMKSAAELKAAFQDQRLMDAAREFAHARGVPIAIFDALSMGLAGRIAKPIAGVVGKLSKPISGVVGQAGELVMQAGFGMAGEAQAQISSTGEIHDELDVLMEGFAEFGPGIVEGVVGRHLRKRAEAKRAGVEDPNTSPLAALDKAEPEEGQIDSPIAATDIDPQTGQVITRTGDVSQDHLDVALEDGLAGLQMDLEARAMEIDVKVGGALAEAERAKSSTAYLLEVEAKAEARRKREQPRTDEEKASLLAESIRRVINQINAARAQAQPPLPPLTEQEINDPAFRARLEWLAQQWITPTSRDIQDDAAWESQYDAIINELFPTESSLLTAPAFRQIPGDERTPDERNPQSPNYRPASGGETVLTENELLLRQGTVPPRGELLYPDRMEGEPVDLAGAQPIGEGMIVLASGEVVVNPVGGRPFNTQLSDALRAAGYPLAPDDKRPPPGGGGAGGGVVLGPDVTPAEERARESLLRQEEDRQFAEEDAAERAAIADEQPAEAYDDSDIPGFEPEGPQPQVEWADPRLADESFHNGLDALISDTQAGGGVTLLPDTEAPGYAGPGTATSYIGRTPSTNPPWMQGIIAEEGVGRKYVINTVDKAKAGKRLGKKQKRVIQIMLDEIESPSRYEVEIEQEAAADRAEEAEIAAAIDELPPAFTEESIAEGGLPEEVIYQSERIKVTGISRIGGDMVVSGTKPDGTEIRFPLAYANVAMAPTPDFALEQEQDGVAPMPRSEAPQEQVDADLGIVGDMFSVEANKQVDLVEETRRLAKEERGIPKGLELREMKPSDLAALVTETEQEIEAFAEKGETQGGFSQTSILAGIQKLKLHGHPQAANLMASATAAFEAHGLTQSPLDAKVKPNKKLRVNIASGVTVDVLQNPTDEQLRLFRQGIRMEYQEKGFNIGTDPLTRTTRDADGNKWVWAATDAIHVVMEDSLTAQFGAEIVPPLGQNQTEIAGLDAAAMTLQERHYNAEALHEKWRKQIESRDPDPDEIAEVERVINDMAASGDPDAFLLAIEHDWWSNWGETEITKSEQGPGRKPIPIRIKSNHERYKKSRKSNKWGSVGGLEKVSSQGVSADISQLSWTVPYDTLTFETAQDQARLERLIEVYNQTHETPVAGSPPAPVTTPAGFVIDEKKFNEMGPDTEERVFAATVPKKRTALDIRLKNAGEPFMSVEEASAIVTRWEDHAINQGKESRKVSHSGPEAHKDNFNRVIISLFDTTGTWANPYALAGYDVRTLDLKDGVDITDFSVEFMDEMFNNFEGKEIYGILAACPCTTFSNSSTRWRKDRHENTDPIESRKWIKEIWGVEAAEAVDENGNWLYESAHDYGIALVHKTMQTLEYLRPKFWALENPEGRIESSAGLPDKWRTGFQPNNFGDPYTKRTLLWGKFNDDMPTANVEPVEGSKMHLMSPSADRSAARAETPVGFSYAFFMANNYLDMSPVERTKADYWYVAGAIEEAFRAGVTETEIRQNVYLDEAYEGGDIEATKQAIRDLIEKPPGTPPTDTTPGEGGGPAGGLGGLAGVGRSTIETIRSKSATALSKQDKTDLQAYAIRLGLDESGSKMDIAKRLKAAVEQHPLERRAVPREAPIVSDIVEPPDAVMSLNEARAEGRQESLKKAGFASEAALAKATKEQTLAEQFTTKGVAESQESLGDVINPKIAGLVSGLNKANIVTTMSGDLYADDLVYVDLRGPVDAGVMMPVGWIVTAVDSALSYADITGNTVVYANGETMPDDVIASRRLEANGGRSRIARAGGKKVSKADIKALVIALADTALRPPAVSESAIAAAEADTDTDATDAQIKANNYKKGRLILPGDIEFATETPRGEKRQGNLKMRDTYGEFTGTEGADGDPVDAFVNSKMQEDWAGDIYIVDQVFPEVGGFDEHKVMFGYNNLIDARRAYRRNYNKDWKGEGAVTKMTLDEFKSWLAEPGPHKTPAALSKVTEAGRKARAENAKNQRYASGKYILGVNKAWIDAAFGGGERKLGDMPDTVPLNTAVSQLLAIREERALLEADIAGTTEDFGTWFADSKVVDKEGVPLVVFHGTDQGFETFDPATQGRNTGAPSAKEGFFFSSKLRSGEYYSRGQSPNIESAWRRAKHEGTPGPSVKTVYLAMQNPLIHDFKGKVYRETRYSELVERAKAAGHDGVIMENTYDAGEYSKMDAILMGRFSGETIYVVFDASQIRSVDQVQRDSAPAAPAQPSFEAIAAAIKPVEDKLPGAPVTLLNNYKQAPAAVTKAMEDRGMTHVKAVFDPQTGKIYIFADKIGSIDEAVRTALHEKTHRGLRVAFGERLNPLLDDIYKNATDQRQVNMNTIAERYKLDPNSREDQRQIAEELLTHMAEYDVNNGIVNRAVAFIRKLLRGMGITLRFTDNDIRAIIREAQGSITRKQASLAGVMIDEEVTVEGSDEVYIVEQDAETAMANINKRIEICKKLRACV